MVSVLDFPKNKCGNHVVRIRDSREQRYTFGGEPITRERFIVFQPREGRIVLRTNGHQSYRDINGSGKRHGGISVDEMNQWWAKNSHKYL